MRYKFNKLKLLLHRATLKNYESAMRKHYTVRYVEFDKPIAPHIKKDTCMFFQPNRMKTYGELLPSPNFLCVELFAEYRAKTDKFRFNNFYMWMKARLGILPKIKSQDKQNRNKLTAAAVDAMPRDRFFTSAEVAAAAKYVEKHFPDNPGPPLTGRNATTKFLFPISHAQSRVQLATFVTKKLRDFGKFQDALLFPSADSGEPDNLTLYHSCISSSLNIGLLNPRQVIDAVLAHRAPINSTEGFIRQMFWREYQLFCYKFMRLNKCRFTANKRGLTAAWIKGVTGVEPIDQTIKKAFATGYLHHIERLMVMGNFMLLSGLSPSAAHSWYMAFAIDGDLWLMHQNVMDMVFGMGGGMSRLYISSSNYILKMSNLKKGAWCDEWDELYHSFLKRNKGKVGYPYE